MERERGLAIEDEAIAWHLRLNDADAQGWRDFVLWLETSPDHRDAYDRLTMEDANLSAALDYPAPGAHHEHGADVLVTRRRMILAGGVAAMLAAGMAVAPSLIGTSAHYVVETSPGAHRTVALSDGSRIVLNGGTRLVLDRNNARVAMLERGEAIFHIVHNATAPFEVQSGSVTLRDMGTVFNVVRSQTQFAVAVAEGEVLYRPDHEGVSLKPGVALSAGADGAQPILSHAPVENIGGWTRGRLDFRNAPLSVVTEDVERSIGLPLAIAPALSTARFTGTVRTDATPDTVVARLAALAGVNVTHDGARRILVPAGADATD